MRGLALSWFRSYLSGRSLCTYVAGKLSAFEALHAAVRQGAILSPRLFLMYVNDLPSLARCSDVNLFADDTSASVCAKSVSSLSAKLHSALAECVDWFDKWHLSVNDRKTELLVMRSKKMKPASISLCLKSVNIPQVTTHKHLGLIFNEFLTWSDPARYVSSNASRKLDLLRRLRKRLFPLVIQHLYCSSVRPAMEYASLVWSGLSPSYAEQLERVQRRAARLISNISALSDTPHDILLARAGLQPLSRRRHIEQAVFAFRFVSGCSLPRHIQLLSHWLSAKPSAACRLRNADSIRLPRPKKNVLKASPLYISLSIWNNLSSDAKSSKSPRGLRSLLCRSI